MLYLFRWSGTEHGSMGFGGLRYSGLLVLPAKRFPFYQQHRSHGNKKKREREEKKRKRKRREQREEGKRISVSANISIG